jgi:hypothetical protein
MLCFSPGHHPPFYKTWLKVGLGLKLMLTLSFSYQKKVTASFLNQDYLRPRFIIMGHMAITNNLVDKNTKVN